MKDNIVSHEDLTSVKCPICGGFENYRVLWQEKLNNISAFDFSSRRLKDKRHHRIVKCRKCGLIYSNPILKNEAIVNFYKDSKFIMEKQILNQLEIYLHYLKKIDNLVSYKDNLLEIGCGNGYFLKAAKEFGYKNVFGVEPSIGCLKVAEPSIRANIINDIFKDGLFQKNLFDVVIMFQVVEHIPGPNELLQNIYKILKEDGVVLVISNNIKSFLNYIFGENSPHIGIAHLYFFDKRTLKQIFEKNDFKVVLAKDILYSYNIKYVFTHLPIPAFVKKIIIFISTKLGLLDRNIRWWGGNMVLVAKKHEFIRTGLS